MSDHAPSLNALADSLLRALFLTMRRIRRENAQASSMGYPDLMILFYLRRSPGIGVSDLAAEAGVRGPTMSGQVKRLEAAGLILREPGPDSDRRRVRLILAPAATAMIDSVKRQDTDWLAGRLAELSAADRGTIAQAIPALHALSGGTAALDETNQKATVKFQ